MIRLYGNDKLFSLLENNIKNKTLSHAYIISGIKGSGKHTLAKFISSELAKDDINRDKIIRGVSPDVVTVGTEGERKSIGVDTIRNIKAYAYIKPNELDFKVYVVEDTQLMTVQAQNAFLKLLEEPPSNVYFLLLCENTSNLLVTVRSRASEIKMRVFGNDEMREYLLLNSKKARDLNKKDSKLLDFVISISEGSIGLAEENLSAKNSGKFFELDSKIDELFGILKARDRAKLFIKIPEILPSKREELVYTLEYTQNKLSISTVFASEHVIKMYYAIDNVKNDLSANINIQTAQLKLMNDLWKAYTGKVNSKYE